MQAREKVANSGDSDSNAAVVGEKKGGSRWFGGGGGKSSTKKEKERGGDGEGDKEELVEGLRVDQYLVVFLKFMSSIGMSPFHSPCRHVRRRGWSS